MFRKFRKLSQLRQENIKLKNDNNYLATTWSAFSEVLHDMTKSGEITWEQYETICFKAGELMQDDTWVCKELDVLFKEKAMFEKMHGSKELE